MRMERIKQEIFKSKTKEEILKNIEDRLFMLDMIDMQTEDDKDLIRDLINLREDVKNDKIPEITKEI